MQERSALGAVAGDERPVAVDDLFGVDGLVSHCGVDVAVPGRQLGDVRRHPVHDRIGDEQRARMWSLPVVHWAASRCRRMLTGGERGYQWSLPRLFMVGGTGAGPGTA
jgi:hypothetical protein